MTATDTSKMPSPADIGKTFAKQYYTLLNREGAKISGFYEKDSVMVHGMEGDQESKVVIGPLQIAQRVVDLELQSCKVFITNLDCQPSVNGGLVVMTLGELALKNGVARRFCQTFFLAVQSAGGYYVRNDIFRFLQDEQHVEVPTKEEHKPAEVKPVATPVKAQAASAPAQKQAPAVPEKPAGPSSWASITATSTEKWGGEISAAKGTVAPVVEEKPKKKEFNKTERPARDNRGEERKEFKKDTSVFVKNIPSGTTQEQLTAAFSKFGQVKSVEFNSSKLNAVVDFISAEFAKKAIKQEVTLNEKQLVIEERKRVFPPVASTGSKTSQQRAPAPAQDKKPKETK